ncbi:MAG: response regulator [Verrucomicrobia bacterium]|nr:response regulator [Verrucomicrobiota bacterium]MBU1734355.1 response regulator [Verrucomicrobiota bacterium]MBU1856252.1 response regulator [Verrucomicrobiota bacterium]
MSLGKKILIVEDEPDFRVALRMRLEANGYDIIEADDGVRGLDAVRQQNPDLIILDVMLPRMNGFKVARLLKYSAKYKNVPLMMLTVMSQESDRKMGREVGADAYLTKPYQPQELLDTISTLVSRQPAFTSS